MTLHLCIGKEVVDGTALPTQMISLRMVMGAVVGSSTRKMYL